MRMLRIRRKFTLILCFVCIALFLFLYLLINYSIPFDKQKLQDTDNQLKQLENGLNVQHHHRIKDANKEYYVGGGFSNFIGTVEFDNDGKIKKNYFGEKLSLKSPPLQKTGEIAAADNSLDKKQMFKDSIINANNYAKCSIQTETAPQPDIQMLELYKMLPFDNLDGGPWKQGWRIKYDSKQFNKHHKLKVFVVPHSHNDPGWLKTFDDYYEHDTKHILSNALRHLTENPSMKFIWAEISYFSRFYEPLNENSKEKIRKLVKNGQLEFVTGGWVMPDEANSNWKSVLLQLTEGQDWLMKHLNTTPISSWAIDPFGHSPTMPLLLKLSGFENLLIQRAHYSVKKRLASEKQLEFKWRQIWDGTGTTDLFTHMMPFYSYDVPHTCGPDPKVCCQFDFKRLPGFGITCPWKISPKVIDDSNVAKKAELIIDQWRKKSILYKTRAVLIPLGDDFRYSQSTEWEAQRKNYEKLFDYINNNPSLYTEARFATLQEYFDEVRKDKDLSEFPTLSGDFFTYADRDDHYWSGYYTSRPYHKRMDRVLLHYIRSAEMLRAWHYWEKDSKLDEKLQFARQQLSLFQHHDGITGTAKNDVVIDYANRMIEATQNCKFVMQQSTYRLLTKPNIYQPDYQYQYFHLDDSRWPGPDDSRMTIILGDELPTKHLVFQNTLPQWREEIIEVYVSKPFVFVTDFDLQKIPSQVSPAWSWHKGFASITIPQASNTKFRLLFKVKVPPIGLSTYIVHYSKNDENNRQNSFSKNTILTMEPFSVNLGDYPHQVDFAEPHEISLKVGDGPTASFNVNGLLKSITLNENSDPISTHIEFLKYGTRYSGGSSGAYLFLPDGPATALPLGNPTILLTQGKLESSLTVGFPFATHSTILRGDIGIEIRNLVDITNMDNTEVVMRISTAINNDDIFYTDLNGLQIIKRKRFSKIPLQANYYPIPSTIMIEDDQTRLTLFSAQPLGGSSLKSGEIEIMQDRRLLQDDERGLAQGVLDNRPVQHIFRLILESREACIKRTPDYPASFLTATAFKELQSLQSPVNVMIWNENDWLGAVGTFGKLHEPLEVGIELSNMKNVEYLKQRDKTRNDGKIGVVVHRANLEECTTDGNREGIINLKRLFNSAKNCDIEETLLTFLKILKKIDDYDINMCPMDIKAFIIER